eukprot:scaffold96433_cov46-Prasinocladus_malaysianus.AAC.1
MQVLSTVDARCVCGPNATRSPRTSNPLRRAAGPTGFHSHHAMYHVRVGPPRDARGACPERTAPSTLVSAW